MKTTIKVLTVLLALFIQNTIKAQDWKMPVIEGYGGIVHYENAQNKPDPSKEYKIIFHIKDGEEIYGVNKGLWKIARLINLMGSYGVPQDHLKIVAVISGKAWLLALADEEHKKRAESANPNLDLLNKLKQKNVRILVCAQSLAKYNIDVDKDLNPYMELTISALTAIPIFQMEGYVPMF